LLLPRSAIRKSISILTDALSFTIVCYTPSVVILLYVHWVYLGSCHGGDGRHIVERLISWRLSLSIVSMVYCIRMDFKWCMSSIDWSLGKFKISISLPRSKILNIHRKIHGIILSLDVWFFIENSSGVWLLELTWILDLLRLNLLKLLLHLQNLFALVLCVIFNSLIFYLISDIGHGGKVVLLVLFVLVFDVWL